MKHLWIVIGGVVFGFGLALSGMTRAEVVLDFLQLEDLGLMLVMAGAIAVTAVAFHLGPRVVTAPPHGEYTAPRTVFRGSTIAGAVLFGVGWGIAGICPGAMIASVGTSNWPILIGIGGALVGAYLQGRFMPEGPEV